MTLAATMTQFGLDGKDRATLRQAGARVTGWLDEVLDHFYDYATAQEQAASFFKSVEMLLHARSQQKKHWAKLLNGEFDEEFAEAAKTIGEVHFRIELPF